MPGISDHGQAAPHRGRFITLPQIAKASMSASTLQNSSGNLQADAYAGFNALYEKGDNGKAQFREATCWAHLRRDFHDVWASDKSQIAREALDRIGKLYDIEREIAGQSADTRLAARQKLSTPKVDAFKLWAEQQRRRAGDAPNWDWTEKLAFCRGRYRRGNSGACHDLDRNRHAQRH